MGYQNINFKVCFSLFSCEELNLCFFDILHGSAGIVQYCVVLGITCLENLVM